MAKILIGLVIIWVAYWYLSGANQNSARTDDPQRNAQIIAECVASGGGSESDGAYTGSGESPQSVCADKHNLYRGYDGWHHR